MSKENERLKLMMWQERLSRAEDAYSERLVRMEEREELYRGARQLRPYVNELKPGGEARHVHNIIAENIESEIDNGIPMPKVTPRRREDEWRAEIIENMLKNEMDRLSCIELNDMQERTVPIQGGGFWLVEWDSAFRSHNINGDVALSVIHPMQVIPQDGVTTGIEDMDYIILKLPQTAAYILTRYGADCSGEGDADGGDPDELVTQYMVYYRNNSGGIGLFSWANDRILEDIEDYQARRIKRCENCNIAEVKICEEDADDSGLVESAAEDVVTRGENGAMMCRYCGGLLRECAEDFEELYVPRVTEHGISIPGAHWERGEDGMARPVPTVIPAYRPGIYPLVLHRNISLYGQLLGDSDVDKISDLQNTVNWLNRKIDSRLMSAGTLITGPAKASFSLDPEDGRVLRLDNAADKSLIDTYEFTGDVDYHFQQLSRAYEAARQVLGITDSYQGRRDTTATTGRAKEIAAAQSAGRLESKRVMKNAAWARIFEILFKFRLAYADEPRPIVASDGRGGAKYDNFDRFDFLEYDEGSGEWWWNDQFIFSCDSGTSFMTNREAMWQEARLNFTSGAYGDPKERETLILFWNEMERLHYPLAAEVKKAIGNGQLTVGN